MCNSCNAIMIMGVPCHETGCPDSWLNPATGEPYPVPCYECGCDFVPEEKSQGEDRFRTCPDCVSS